MKRFFLLSLALMQFGCFSDSDHKITVKNDTPQQDVMSYQAGDMHLSLRLNPSSHTQATSAGAEFRREFAASRAFYEALNYESYRQDVRVREQETAHIYRSGTIISITFILSALVYALATKKDRNGKSC